MALLEDQVVVVTLSMPDFENYDQTRDEVCAAQILLEHLP
jgi:hypothetical protein